MMTLFDAPSRSPVVCALPDQHIVPVLALFNETQRMETARKLAERLIKHDKRDNARMEYLFSLLTSRKPKTVEAVLCLNYWGRRRAALPILQRMRKKFCRRDWHPMMNLYKAVEVAAWTQVAATVLAVIPPFFFTKSFIGKTDDEPSRPFFSIRISD